MGGIDMQCENMFITHTMGNVKIIIIKINHKSHN